ncbi:type IV secretory system conjugative DNA transfer family protein [Nocardia concava]|uniref:type IV secretory system conjugative DNA transfer family protein n=1 Tax=Nocardia concava TaxID=257281 RepID=UPI0002D7306F|nr:type IV secretory system conjugative DNA transfer family protein [Nocardia concava]
MAKAPVKDPADPGPDTTLQLIYAGFAVFGTLWVAVQLGNLLSSPRQHMPINPIAIIVNMVKGDLHWPGAATIIVVVIVLAAIAWQLYKRRQKTVAAKGRLAIDDKADYMGSGGAIKALTAAGVMEKADQIGVPLKKWDQFPGKGRSYIPDSLTDPRLQRKFAQERGIDLEDVQKHFGPLVPGIPIGISVADGEMLYGSYEDLQVDIWGPRQGKTTTRVIPAIVAAVGPVVVTSNKRDVVDATRDVRDNMGSPVFVFDPQSVAPDSRDLMNQHQEPTWYWDPLGWVDVYRPGCEVRAVRLAGHFSDAEGSPSAGQGADSYFDPEAEDLLAALFLAAGFEGSTILRAWDWVNNPLDHTPIEILNMNGMHYMARGLAGQYNLDVRTRDGVFGGAKAMIRSLKLPHIQPWIVPGGNRDRFDESDFIDRNGTLYCLSLEGRGSAAPLVSALTEAVIETATAKATRSPGGRLSVPLLAALDEAANVVRWKDLPKQYSHFGSRGIVVMTVLQSWAQGARCWGPDGMEALWGAANIKVIGSGIDDMNFLQQRSEAIGDYDSISQSVSESKSGKSYSRSLSSSRTFNAHGLATLPRGRAILFPSGMPAVLLRAMPWWEADFAEDVKNSILAHVPSAGKKTEIADLLGSPQLIKEAQADVASPKEVRPL